MQLSRSPVTLPALASGLVTVLLSGAPEGLIHGVEFTFSASLSNAAPFNSKNPTGDSQLARNGDDVDKFLAALIAVSSGVTWNIDGTSPGVVFQGLDPTLLRSALDFINGHDLETTGGFVDGTPIPAGGVTSTIKMYIPAALDRHLLEDGAEFAIGSDRFRKGRYDFNFANPLPATVALNNGTANIAALSWSANYVYDATGPSSRVGPQYKVVDLPNLVSDKPRLDPAARAMLLDDGTTYAGTYTQVGPPVAAINTPGAAYINDYNRGHRVPALSWNPCARARPLVFLPEPKSPLHTLNLQAYSHQVKNDSGNTQHLVSIELAPKSGSALAAQHSEVAGPNGIATIIEHSPRSLPGVPVPARLAPWVASTVVPGTVRAPGAHVADRAAQAPSKAGVRR